MTKIPEVSSRVFFSKGFEFFNMNSTKTRLPFGEFVVMMAMMSSLIALSIDAMLPALTQIGQDLGVVQSNDTQLIVSMVFLGIAIGQIVYGPLSDSTGRKFPIYIGFILFILGCLLSSFATNFSFMLAGRLLQGIGAAGPRTVSIVLIRDVYSGNAMARVMSFVMMIFILVPVFAPAIGQVILFISHWRVIFVLFLALAITSGLWFTLRQPETLPTEQRIPFSIRRILNAILEVCRNRVSLGYTIASGLIAGAFVGYLGSSQQILQIQYALGTKFPLYFGALAFAIGIALFINGRMVMRYGMRILSTGAAVVFSGSSIVYFLVAILQSGHPPLWTLMVFGMVAFFCVGMLFGNFNAMAMEPLGHIAGVGATVVGSLTLFIAVPMGIMISQNYNQTILPLVGGFAILGILSLIAIHWAKQGQKTF